MTSEIAALSVTAATIAFHRSAAAIPSRPLCSGENPLRRLGEILVNFTGGGGQAKQRLWRLEGNQRPLPEDGDPGRRGLDVRDDVGGENHQLGAAEICEEVAESNPFFGIEPGGWFINNNNFRVVY